MSDEAAKHHEIHYKVDDEKQTTTAKQLTPVQIMSSAGIDPQTNYLEQLLGDHEHKSYKDNPNQEIEMENHMRFITKPLGHMHVS